MAIPVWSTPRDSLNRFNLVFSRCPYEESPLSLPFYAENPSPTDQTGKSSSLLPPDVVYSLRQGPSLSKRRRWRRSFGSRRSLNKKWEEPNQAEATNPTPDTGRRRGRRLRRTESFQLRVQPDLRSRAMPLF